MKKLFIALLIGSIFLNTAIADVLHRNPFLKSNRSSADFDDIHSCSFNALRLIGVYQQKEWFALMSDTKNNVYFLKLNASIGLEHAKITHISADGIDLEWVEQGKILTEHVEM